MTRHARRPRRPNGLPRTSAALLRAVASAVIVLGASSFGISCHRSESDAGPIPSAAPARDRLAPGELVEGPLRAFELKLPQGMEIRETFAAVVYAAGPVDPMRLANYVRTQVTGGSISVGAAATVFDEVTVPANPKRLLRVRVETIAQGHKARLEVRDITPPPPPPPAADDAERWRRVGMTPDGKLLDPSHLR